MINSGVRVDLAAIQAWAESCLRQAGASKPIAYDMAHYLLQGDLLGFRTHGLARLKYNIDQLANGGTSKTGDITVLNERRAVANWDANFLSGLHVVPKAVQKAIDQARECGTGTVLVRRAQHVASLACYLELATSQGMAITMMASTPAQQVVAPFGGKSATFSPNPFAFAVPTKTLPIMLDISLSMTAAGKVRQALAEGRKLPYAALITEQGEYTDDPSVFTAEPPAVLATLGGADLGYKGSGLTLFSEIFTMALGQYGRLQGTQDADANSVWIHVIDPTAFGELDEFLIQTQAQADALREATPIAANRPVRVPGESAQRHKQEQLEQGVWYSDALWQQLQKLAERCQLPLPATHA